jgi:hypothetical protein
MTCPPFKRGCVLLVFGAILLAAAPAWAALGAGESEIAQEQNTLRASLTVRAMDAYAVHTLSTDNGLNIREFADKSGRVFAVAWDGPARPDLQQLLGGYYAQYSAAILKMQPLGLHRSVRIDTGTMRVELGGHMRAYVGRAYLPALVPAGVNTSELR